MCKLEWVMFRYFLGMFTTQYQNAPNSFVTTHLYITSKLSLSSFPHKNLHKSYIATFQINALIQNLTSTTCFETHGFIIRQTACFCMVLIFIHLFRQSSTLPPARLLT
jgi:hypothetical protein